MKLTVQLLFGSVFVCKVYITFYIQANAEI